MLSTTFHGEAATTMTNLLRRVLTDAFGRAGRHAMLPIINLGDGRWALRFVSKQAPRLVDAVGRRLIVEPGKGSILQIVGELRPMVSSAGLIPIMRQVRVLEFIDAQVDP